MSLTALIDYESGNLHSAEKAFERMAREADAGTVVVTSDADVVAKADRIVLPGDGAFPACAAALRGSGVFDALVEAVENKGRPFLGICVGMQLMASWGREYRDTPGLDWVAGDVLPIRPADTALKVPHMGWNDLMLDAPHPVSTVLRQVITPISCTPITLKWLTLPCVSPTWITAEMLQLLSDAIRCWGCSSILRKARTSACV